MKQNNVSVKIAVLIHYTFYGLGYTVSMDLGKK